MGLFDYIAGIFKPASKAYVSPAHEFTKYDQYKLGQMHAQTRYPVDYLTAFPHKAAEKAYKSGLGASAPAFSPVGGMGGGGGGGYAPQSFSMPEPKKPEVPTLSLDEMMDIINRRVGLMIDPQIEGLRRGLEETRLSHEKQVGDTKAGYEEARGQLEKVSQQKQQEGAASARKRGIYDSGLAVDLANRIQRQMGEHGLKLETEQARALADLASYLALQEKQTGKEIQGLEGRRGEWSQSLLDEMQQQERDRQDRLEQQAFENWLSQTAMEQQVWQANQAARAAAARSAGGSARPASFKDIIDQAMAAQFMNMPSQQQQAYLRAQMFPQQQTSYSDLLDQLRWQAILGMEPEQRNKVLFPNSFVYP